MTIHNSKRCSESHRPTSDCTVRESVLDWNSVQTKKPLENSHTLHQNHNHYTHSLYTADKHLPTNRRFRPFPGKCLLKWVCVQDCTSDKSLRYRLCNFQWFLWEQYTTGNLEFLFFFPMDKISKFGLHCKINHIQRCLGPNKNLLRK